MIQKFIINFGHFITWQVSWACNTPATFLTFKTEMRSCSHYCLAAAIAKAFNSRSRPGQFCKKKYWFIYLDNLWYLELNGNTQLPQEFNCETHLFCKNKSTSLLRYCFHRTDVYTVIRQRLVSFISSLCYKSTAILYCRGIATNRLQYEATCYMECSGTFSAFLE